MTSRYARRLAEYARFAEGGGCLFRPVCLEGGSVTAEAAMADWESRGVALPAQVIGAVRLSTYVQGKRSRDWHISEWRQGVREGWFRMEEFVGTFGLTEADVQRVMR